MEIIRKILGFRRIVIESFKREYKTIKSCFTLLSKREIRKIKCVAVAQLLLAILDFFGVVLIGLIGMLSVYGIQSRTPSGQLKWFLDFTNITKLPLQSQVAAVGIIAALALITKTFVSAWINKRTMMFLANRSADLSIRIIEKLAYSNLEQIKRRTRFENIFALTSGVQSITIGMIGTIVSLFADLILIVIMFIGLLAIDTSIAFSTVLLFGSVALCLYFMVNSRISFLAKTDADLQIKNNQLLYELFGSFREIFVSGKRNNYLLRLSGIRRDGAEIAAKLAFVPSISKYVLEVAFVLGAIVFVALQFLFKDAVGAISSISIFIASAGRVVPAILRIQSSALSFRGSLSSASRTLELIDELTHFSVPNLKNGVDLEPEFQDSFEGKVDLFGVSFHYSNSDYNVLNEIDLHIESGEWLAVVGPSGAGKTTLVDVILGILKPITGQANISNIEAEVAVTSWPGRVSYVPQDTFLINGTIEENIAFGFSKNEIDEMHVEDCLNKVGLLEFVNKLDSGTKFNVGELGSKLSGGQKQRLGIARALYTNPELLILDEATSALDPLSEIKIIECLSKLKGKISIISIAHRLSTVINSDRVIYMEEGRILASGTFQEVRNKVPNFEIQAHLANIPSEK